MRFLVLSDLHANLEALLAVMEDASGRFDQIVCCGDLVGYNADPSAVVDWVQRHCQFVIRGNHDKVVSGLDDLDAFTDAARAAAIWTRTQLSPGHLTYLQGLPKGPLRAFDFELVHGATFDEDEYVTSLPVADESFFGLDGGLGFFGHTHVQGGFLKKMRQLGRLPHIHPGEPELVVELEPDRLYLMNPGSTGQPRDGDPRAAYAIYDSGRRVMHFRRVAYDIQSASEKIRLAGLPSMLALRLFKGQ